MKTGKMILMIGFLLANVAVYAQLAPFYSAASGKYGYNDLKGKEIIAPRYDLAYPFTEGMSAFRLNGKFGYLNENGKVIVSPKYDFTWHFIGGYATVRLGDKFGFIDKNGREVISLRYEEANNYHGNCCYKGMAHVKEKGEWKIIRLKE